MNTDVIYPLAQFAARSRDEEVLRVSSSGGVFTELARVVLANKGVVVAAGWNRSTMTVEHRCVETEAELSDLRGSKYVTSDMSRIFKSMDQYVAEGRSVFFVGTPCQVAAIRRYFGKPKNLILCAIACHSNVPTDVWVMYCKDLQQKIGSRITDVHFRNKLRGWRKSTLCINFEDDARNIQEPWLENFYAKVFFSGWATKSACLGCPFRAGRCRADILIGDFWGVEDVLPLMDDGRGVSVVLVYTQTGNAILQMADISTTVVSYHDAVRRNPHLVKSPEIDAVKRARFQRIYRQCGLHKAMRYAEWGPLPIEIPVRCYRWARHVAGKFLRII